MRVSLEYTTNGSPVESRKKDTDNGYVYAKFITGDIVGEEWDRADLGGHRERDKQLLAFEAALLIAEELRQG